MSLFAWVSLKFALKAWWETFGTIYLYPLSDRTRTETKSLTEILKTFLDSLGAGLQLLLLVFA